jgi:hypothetical protein
MNARKSSVLLRSSRSHFLEAVKLRSALPCPCPQSSTVVFRNGVEEADFVDRTFSVASVASVAFGCRMVAGDGLFEPGALASAPVLQCCAHMYSRLSLQMRVRRASCA